MDWSIVMLLDVFLELFAEGFLSLSSVFFPNRSMSGRAQRILRVVVSLLAALMLVLLIIGVIFLAASQGESILGWIFVGVCSIYVLTAIVLKIIAEIKK